MRKEVAWFLCGLLQQGKRRIPIWIVSIREREVDNDEQLHVLYGLPQQDFSSMVLHNCYRRKVIGPDFDVGRVSRFQCGLLHENFSLIVLRRYYKRRGFVQSWERVSLFQCGFLHQDYFITVLHRCHKRRTGSREEGGCENPCVTQLIPDLVEFFKIKISPLFISNVTRGRS